jgi:N utilization substance protein A
LNNEKIDIINWSSEPEIFITRSLSPAKPKRIAIDEEMRKVIAVLDDDQISLAIGKGGQNRRLAVRLTGYDIQTVKEEEYQKLMAAEESIETPLDEECGLTAKVINTLHLGGYESIPAVLRAGAEKLTELPGIGSKTAEKIIQTLEAKMNSLNTQ